MTFQIKSINEFDKYTEIIDNFQRYNEINEQLEQIVKTYETEIKNINDKISSKICKYERYNKQIYYNGELKKLRLDYVQKHKSDVEDLKKLKSNIKPYCSTTVCGDRNVENFIESSVKSNHDQMFNDSIIQLIKKTIINDTETEWENLKEVIDKSILEHESSIEYEKEKCNQLDVENQRYRNTSIYISKDIDSDIVEREIVINKLKNEIRDLNEKRRQQLKLILDFDPSLNNSNFNNYFIILFGFVLIIVSIIFNLFF